MKTFWVYMSVWAGWSFFVWLVAQAMYSDFGGYDFMWYMYLGTMVMWIDMGITDIICRIKGYRHISSARAIMAMIFIGITPLFTAVFLPNAQSRRY